MSESENGNHSIRVKLGQASKIRHLMMQIEHNVSRGEYKRAADLHRALVDLKTESARAFASLK
ncbi:hypothetical protein BK004_03145 [bacterium CG10_46_32]|nr:MAG: hypothetical protein BK004_03145 [bacterium CG10_46_32]